MFFVFCFHCKEAHENMGFFFSWGQLDPTHYFSRFKLILQILKNKDVIVCALLDPEYKNLTVK